MSWSLMVRIKIFLVIILCIISGFFLFKGDKISSKIVGNPPCLKGSLEERCYDGKGVSFENVVYTQDEKNNPVLVYQIVNSLPFGYTKVNVTFDIYTETGSFLETIQKELSLLPLTVTSVVLNTAQNVTTQPRVIIPTIISKGKPEFIKGSKDFKAYTVSLFSVIDSKFSRNITIPIQFHGSIIPPTQNFNVLIQGFYRQKEDQNITLVRRTTVFYPQKDISQTIITTEIPLDFTVTNVSVSCEQGCLSI